MRSPKVLILSGSNRGGSHNTRLAASAHKVFGGMDCDATRISLRDYPLPIFDRDAEAQKGPPENAIKLARLFHNHDGILLVTPEYNGSITPLLKNTLDWISRISSDNNGQLIAYKGKVAAIASASPGRLGGIRALGHLRDILTSLGACVIAEQVAVGNAGSAFDDMDQLTDERTRGILVTSCTSLVKTSRLLSMRS